MLFNVSNKSHKNKPKTNPFKIDLMINLKLQFFFLIKIAKMNDNNIKTNGNTGKSMEADQ